MGTHTAQPRLLIFVIAYYAEAKLEWVLDRIPRSIFDEFDCEVLIVDDASDDRTFEIGQDYKRRHPELRMTVLRNAYNQGYGGNQKVGYTYAVTEGFDLVAMVHGDGQYAPEELPRLLAPLVAGEADAVFGSRMIGRIDALKGGMPLYKFVGNKILTTAQNALLGTKLSEFHSGYRVYSTRALSKIPFRLNVNDFHFDTEIIIQLLDAQQRIVELPIPTYYGDEISRVSGLRYARDVMMTTLKYRVHKLGLLYRRQFDTSPPDNSHYDLKLGYRSSHSMALDAVAPGSKVLDIGAGPGGLAQQLVARGCEVAVVDQFAPTTPTPEVTVYVQNLDDTPRFPVRPYQYFLLLDVIEHLHDPEAFLDKLRAGLDHQPRTMVLTTPNIAFVAQRLMLALGEFNYGKAGILDRTHTRLFTFRSLRRLLRDTGFRIRRVEGIPAPFPKALGDNTLSRTLLALNIAAIRVAPTLFSYQILVVAETTPTTEFVLADTRRASQDRIDADNLRRGPGFTR